MNQNQFLKQKGMTLVETMVAGAILAGLAVAGMTMFKNQTVGQKTVEANYEVTNLFQQIRVVLSDQQNCTQSFSGKNPNGDSSVANLYKKRVGAAGYDTVYTTNTQISGSNVKITSFRLERTPSANLADNETWLKINFSKGKSTLMENTTKMMKVIVSPSPASSNTSITSCYAYNNSTDTYWIQGTPPDIYFTAGKVGISNTSPERPLHVGSSSSDGSILIQRTGTPHIEMIQNGAAANSRRWRMGTENDGRFWIMPYDDAAVPNNIGNGVQITNAGKVGIGTTNPSSLLTIGSSFAGSANSTTFSSNAGSLSSTSGTELLLASIGFNSSNESHLGIRALRTSAGSDWTTTAIGLGMDVDNTPRAGGASLWLHSNGNLGIGVTAPTSKLEIGGTEAYESRLVFAASDSTDRFSFLTDLDPVVNNDLLSLRSTNVDNMLTLRGDGTVGIGQTPTGYRLTVSGDVYANGGWLRTSGSAGWYSETYGGGWHMTDTTWLRAYNNKNVYTGGQIRADGSMQVGGSSEITMDPASGINSLNGYWYPSDRRLKKDITNLDHGLEKILKMKPRNYTWKKSGKKETGFIAQELQSIDPRLVQEMTNKQKTLTLKHEGMLPYIVKAIQELYEMIIGHNEEIVELKKENKELRARLDRQDIALKRIEERANAGK